MLGLLVDAALRSTVLGGAAWLGLTLTRVRNPQARMTAWSVVLIVSMAMPLLTPWMRLTIPGGHVSPRLVKVAWTEVPWIVPRAPRPAEPPAAIAPAPDATAPAPSRAPILARDWRWLANGVYVSVCGAMLLRLLIACRWSRPLG
jgi:hypothetical protein